MSTQVVPLEADWKKAPSVISGAMNVVLTPQECNLDYWFASVPRGTLQGLVRGHSPSAAVPDYMRAPGPLRDAIVSEFAFRSISEEKATRAICYMVANAPDLANMEFFATQMIDEARHSRVFRGHMLELGFPQATLSETIEGIAGADSRAILVPLEDFALPLVRDQRDFIAGVVILTILVEGVLAPSAELSERKWRVLDPAAAEIERGANIDEIRHLTVGAAVVQQYLQKRPDEKDRLLEIIMRGRKLWSELPTNDVIFKREGSFQQGMMEQSLVVGDYEIWDGRRLIDTTPEERLVTANNWSMEMQNSRLDYMGLSEAI
jgi:hypothetical protein